MTQEEFISQLQELQRIAPLVDNDQTVEQLIERRKKASEPTNYTREGQSQSNAEMFAEIIREEKAAQEAVVQAESELEQLTARLETAKRNRNILALSERRELTEVINKLNMTNSLITSKNLSFDENVDYNAEISKVDNLIDDLKSKLNAEKDTLKIAEYNSKIDSLGKEKEGFELLATKSKLEKQLALSKKRLELWDENIPYIENQIQQQKDKIEKARKDAKNASARLNYYNDLQRNYSGQNIDYVDLIQERALYTKDKNDFLNQMETDYSSRFFSATISKMINKLSNQEITIEETQEQLRQYAANHFDKATLANIRKERYADIKKISTEIANKEYEINMLNLKLSDDANYANETYRESILNKIEITGIEYEEAIENRNKVLAQIDSNTDEIFKLESEIKEFEKNKATLEKTKEEIYEKMKNPVFDMDYKRSLASQLTQLVNHVNGAQVEINKRRRKISELLDENRKKREQIQKEEEQKLISKLKTTLDEMKSKYGYDEQTHTISSNIDEVVKEADKKRLEELKNELKQLKDKQTVANLDFVDQIDMLANAKVTGLTQGGPSQGGQKASGSPTPTTPPTPTGPSGSTGNTSSGQGNDSAEPSWMDKLKDYHMDGAALDRLEEQGVYLASKLKVKPSSKQVLSEKYKELKKWLQEHSKLNKKKKIKVQDEPDQNQSLDPDQSSKTI